MLKQRFVDESRRVQYNPNILSGNYVETKICDVSLRVQIVFLVKARSFQKSNQRSSTNLDDRSKFLRLRYFSLTTQQYLETDRLKMLFHLSWTPVLSQMTIDAVRKEHTNTAIGDVDNTGFRIIVNPFNLAAAPASVPSPVLPDRVQPEILRIPEFVEGVSTLEFMGFDTSTAIIIWNKYLNGPPRPENEDLLWCAMQYLTYIEAQATRDGIGDQQMIKQRMGFHYGETLFRIDTEIPVTPVTEFGPRVLFWIIPIISRRYDFVYSLEENLNVSGLSEWSARTEARTMNYGNQALREGVEGWFHHMTNMAMAVEPIIKNSANISICNEEAIMAFEFVNGLDYMPIQEEATDAVELVGGLPEDMAICKVPLFTESYFIPYRPDESDCENSSIDEPHAHFLPREGKIPLALEVVENR